MNSMQEDLEALRLLKAFAKITDADKRREIIEWVEKLVPHRPDDQSTH